MPIPSSINDLSTSAGSNSPAGSESPSLIDDYLRTYASYIAILRDNKQFPGAMNDAAPQTIASATTTDIGAATSNSVDISGTTTITGLGTIAAGARRSVRFLGALVLTHNATSLILEGGLNITTAANDTAEFRSLGSGNWICLRYNRASGAYSRTNILGTVLQSAGVPTGALMEYGTNVGGEYWKFASGLMICAKSTLLGASTAGAGPIFTCTSTAIGTMPATFVSQPYVNAHGITNALGGGWASCYAFWSTSNWGNWAIYTEVSRAGATTLTLFAIGRWF
jgi:hypothetical protein